MAHLEAVAAKKQAAGPSEKGERDLLAIVFGEVVEGHLEGMPRGSKSALGAAVAGEDAAAKADPGAAASMAHVVLKVYRHLSYDVVKKIAGFLKKKPSELLQEVVDRLRERGE